MVIDKPMVHFLCTFTALVIFAIVALVNLSISNEKQDVWAAIAYTLIGVLIPQPKYKRKGLPSDGTSYSWDATDHPRTPPAPPVSNA